MSKILNGLIPLTPLDVLNLTKKKSIIFLFPPTSVFRDYEYSELNVGSTYIFEKEYNEGKSLKLKGFEFIYPSEFFALLV